MQDQELRGIPKWQVTTPTQKDQGGCWTLLTFTSAWNIAWNIRTKFLSQVPPKEWFLDLPDLLLRGYVLYVPSNSHPKRLVLVCTSSWFWYVLVTFCEVDPPPPNQKAGARARHPCPYAALTHREVQPDLVRMHRAGEGRRRRTRRGWCGGLRCR